MKTHFSFMIPVFVAVGCVGTVSVLGIPTVVSDAAFDLAPEVTNPEEVRKAMQAEYPPLLRDAGIGGKAVLRLYVDETGQVQHFAVEESSSDPALDELALKLAPIIQFNPAQSGDEAVPVLATVPMNFIPPPPGRVEKRVIRREN